MCDDLIAHHYYHTSGNHILHPPSSLKLPASNPYYCFSLLNSSDEISRVWFIVRSSGHTPSSYFSKFKDILPLFPPELNPHLETGPVPNQVVSWTSTDKFTINSYDSKIVDWALRENLRSHPLYEMKLTLLSAPLSRNSTRTSISSTTSATPKDIKIDDSFTSIDGFAIRTGPSETEWYLEKFPQSASTITHGGETVVTIIDTIVGEQAGYLTLLPSRARKRIYISSLGILPFYRKRGLAKFLLQNVHEMHRRGEFRRPSGVTTEIEERETDGLEKEVWLTVFCENLPAVRLYFGLGYKPERLLWAVNGDQKVVGEEK
ncbi:hypothetical protein RUND412_003400 [Rhizina undulata]